MQPVHAPARIGGRRPPAAALLVAVVALALIGAGVSLLPGSRPAEPAVHHGPPIATIGGKALQQANCTQWLGGTPDQRAAVVEALAKVVGGATPYGPASKLTRQQAFALFNRRCAQPYARGFLLYELYTRAAAFQHATDHFE